MTLARILVSEFIADSKEHRILRVARRAARKSRILAMGRAYRQLTSMPAYHHHLATLSTENRLFFLSERHYLASGLTGRQRMAAALVHYGHESEAFDEDYFRHVYHGGGLVLWRSVNAGVEYDIRLVPGKDVAHEGGLSIVLNVDGACVCIISYSMAPMGMLLAGEPREAVDARLGDSVIFVTRKHLARDHNYQAKFNKAFDRTTPSHLCFGALVGIAQAQGHHHVVGISPERHPAFSYSFHGTFVSTYADFWISLMGRKISPLGYLIDLPIQLTPLTDLESSKRKRAMARRAHIDAVQRSAMAVTSTHLRAR